MKNETLSQEIKSFVSMPRYSSEVLLSANSAYPKISVIMPSFNQARFIERSILSVLNQNYPNLELIIIDGGSSDGTVEIIKQYENYISYWVSESDGGQSDALNKGLEQATGEWIGWQNSDDIYFDGTFNQVCHIIRKDLPIGIICGAVATIDRNDEIIMLSKFTTPSFQRLLYEGLIMSSQGVFWKKDFDGGSSNFSVSYCHAMDYDLWLRILRQHQALFVPRVFGGFRVYPGTKTSEHGDKGTKEVNQLRVLYGVNPDSFRFIFIKFIFKVTRIIKWCLFTRPQLSL